MVSVSDVVPGVSAGGGWGPMLSEGGKEVSVMGEKGTMNEDQ